MRANLLTLPLATGIFFSWGATQRTEAQVNGWGLSTGTAPWQGSNAHLTVQSGGTSPHDYFPNFSGPSTFDNVAARNYARNLSIAASNTPSGTYPGYYYCPPTTYYSPGVVSAGPHASFPSSGSSGGGVSSGPRSR